MAGKKDIRERVEEMTKKEARKRARELREEADTDRYRGVMGATDEPLVSSDIIADSRASIVDLEMTQVVDGDLVKVMSWYDNEWGYVSQMVRHALSTLQRAGHDFPVPWRLVSPGERAGAEGTFGAGPPGTDRGGSGRGTRHGR